MTGENKVAAIIPAFNEENEIFKTVRAVRCIPEVGCILVVDDGSEDGTAKEALRAGARVLSLPNRKGKGAALSCGLKIVEGDVILFLDADLGDTAREARHLLKPVLEGRADMAIARFPGIKGKSGLGLVRGLARKGVKYFTGLDVGSPLSGQRALRREILRRVAPLPPGFGIEVALTIRAAREGFRILEVPVKMRHRDYGRTPAGFGHRGKQFLAVAAVLIRLLLAGGR